MNVTEYNSCVDKYLKMVYRISFHYFGNREDAEDVSQDVFLKLYSHNTKFESEEELKAWLIRVTTNTCHSYFRNPFRKRKTEIDEKEIENIVGSSSSEQEIINRKVVMDAVMSLSERYRIVAYLYYYEEYSAEEIGQILRKNKNTVYTLLNRGRQLLRSSLEEVGENG